MIVPENKHTIVLHNSRVIHESDVDGGESKTHAHLERTPAFDILKSRVPWVCAELQENTRAWRRHGRLWRRAEEFMIISRFTRPLIIFREVRITIVS